MKHLIYFLHGLLIAGIVCIIVAGVVGVFSFILHFPKTGIGISVVALIYGVGRAMNE